MQWLAGMGGLSQFTDVDAIPKGKPYELEKALVQSRLAERVHAHGMQLYLGMYLANSSNPQTPLGEWFDDAAWRDTVLPAIRDAASAAHTLGFDGLAWDLELYPQADGRTTATWDWDYPGNRADETAVREQVRTRGAEWMAAATEGFPDAKVLVYHSEFPNTWDALVQREVNGTERAYSASTNLDFWNGVTSVDGNWTLTFLNALFYKTTHLDATWDTAYSYELNRLFELFSKRLTNWSRVADQVYASPFVWISAGSTSFEAARDPEYVEEQLLAGAALGHGADLRELHLRHTPHLRLPPVPTRAEGGGSAGGRRRRTTRAHRRRLPWCRRDGRPVGDRDRQHGGAPRALAHGGRRHRRRPAQLGRRRQSGLGLPLAHRLEGHRHPARRRREPGDRHRRRREGPDDESRRHGAAVARCASSTCSGSRASVGPSATSWRCSRNCEARGIDTQMVVLCTGDGDRFVDEMRRVDIDTHAVPGRGHFQPELVPILASKIRRFRPDVVHTHLVDADVYGQLATFATRVPAVSSVHGTPAFYGREPYRTAGRVAGRLARRRIAISHHVAAFLEAGRLAPPSRIRVVPYGIRLDDPGNGHEGPGAA